MKTFGKGVIFGSVLLLLTGMDIFIVLFCALIGIILVVSGSSNDSSNVN